MVSVDRAGPRLRGPCVVRSKLNRFDYVLGGRGSSLYRGAGLRRGGPYVVRTNASVTRDPLPYVDRMTDTHN